MNKIVTTIFGSHLYGLNTPNSDLDYKTVFIPSKRDLLLGTAVDYLDMGTSDSSRKNTKDDVDHKAYSLMKFIGLAKTGDMMAIDMLHTPGLDTLESEAAWHFLVGSRELFYSKDMRTFMGYVKKQTAKYGFRGSRLASAQSVANALRTLPEKEKLGSHLNLIEPHLSPDTVEIIERDANGFLDVKAPVIMVRVCGKTFLAGSRVGEVVKILDKFCDEYGHRAKAAAENNGVDWKAVSHAIRAGYELRSIFTKGTIKFPFVGHEKQTLLEVKTGQKSWDEASAILEAISDEVVSLSEKSGLRETINPEAIDQIALEAYEMMGYTTQ